MANLIGPTMDIESEIGPLGNPQRESGIPPVVLPEEARAKILQRQRMRGELDELTGLLVEDETTL